MVKTSARQIKETDEGWLGTRPWKLWSEHSGCQDCFLALLLWLFPLPRSDPSFVLERYRYYVQHLGLLGRCSLKPTSSNIISGLRASCPIQERQLDSGDCISDASDLPQSDRSEEEVGSRVPTKAGTLWYWASQLQRAGMGGARDWEADNGLGNQRWLEQRMGQATNWKLPVVETWLVLFMFFSKLFSSCWNLGRKKRFGWGGGCDNVVAIFLLYVVEYSSWTLWAFYMQSYLESSGS